MNDRTRLAMLVLGRMGRLVLGSFLKSPFYNWRYGGPPAEQLLLIPQDLRTADASFATEVYHGHFGLAGTVAITNGASPFTIEPPNQVWEKELEGFGWLRHFSAAADPQSLEQAKVFIREWIRRSRRKRGVKWLPDVAARRIISWISHAGYLLDNTDTAFYDSVMHSLTQHIRYVAGYYGETPDGHPRLTSLIALNMAGLCIGEQEDLLNTYLDVLCFELDRQILDDGGHISRNPWVPVSLMLDLLPLKQCFISRSRQPPEQIMNALRRVLSMIRFMRLGDGYIARFNGMAVTLPDSLATVLAYDDNVKKIGGYAPQSGYTRLELGKSILLVDTGTPPSLALSRQAHAGALSFEMSSGVCPIVVNCGAPGPANQEWRLMSRTTPYHSTLSINDNSSSRLLKRKLFERSYSGPMLQGPDQVRVDYRIKPGQVYVEASHNGFSAKYNAIYRRKLCLMKNGNRVYGEEFLFPDQRTSKKNRFPFALHFHIHPDVKTTLAPDKKSVNFLLQNGEIWNLSSSELSPSIEESLFLADYRGPRQTVQIVFHGVCHGKTQFDWILEKIQEAEIFEELPQPSTISISSKPVRPSKE